MNKRCFGCMEEYGDEFELCPHCGYVAGTPVEEAVHMEPGTNLLDRYIIGKVLGYGGFGVTYIAWDKKLEQKVAVKEYLPSEFSTRMPGEAAVTVFGGDRSEQFGEGLDKFIEEAKHLSKFQNETGIVKVFDSFKTNNTAYIVMEYLDGETLTNYIDREGMIPEEKAIEMLAPVMISLQTVHEEGILHRDIAPDNIFLTKNGGVKLIDFGASRYATTSHSRSLTVIIKPGYSPEEQYRSRGDQGPHTDVYALAAVMYKMITGVTPPDALERRALIETKKKESLTDIHKIVKTISPNVENAILNAMNVQIEDRTSDVLSFMSELNSTTTVKRRYGKIKKIDAYAWPLWIKIVIPAVVAAFVATGILLMTGVIDFPSLFSGEVKIPDGMVVVPDVEGMYIDEAIELITDDQLIATTDGTIESQYIPAGKIILQTPIGSSYMNINGTVLLIVSSGQNVQPPENGMSTVPYVLWSTKEEAIAKLILAGLAEPEIVEKYDDNAAEGSVIKQSIHAGEKIDEGTKITLTISLGPAGFDMPDVVGKSKEKAEDTLNGKGLVVLVEYKKDDSVKEGTVLSQSIKKGTSVKQGDEITIIVSTKDATVKLADVVGKPREEAERTLKKQGFKVAVLENYDANVASGNVISQSPAADTTQTVGSTIVIYVSKGKDNAASNDTQTTNPSKGDFTITFDATGGNVTPSTQSVKNGSTYGTLPTPEREGYVFDGWYTAKNGGSKITASSKVTITSNQTLYAQWSKVEISSISIKSKPNKTSYCVGDTIDITGLTLTVKYKDGTSKTVSSGFNCSPTSLSSAGTKNITVSYGGYSTTFTVTVEDVIAGKDGNISWKLMSDGTLYISGNGAMKDYSHENSPWKSVTNDITGVVIESGVTSIGDYAFVECSKLKNIQIANSVTDIGDRAFQNCSSLTSVTIPGKVATIGDYMFLNCKSLKTVVIESGVKTISSNMFKACLALESITLPNTIKSIGSDAFSTCTSLKSINIPTSVTSFGDRAFQNCKSLATINYSGTIDQWTNISKKSTWNSNTAKYVIYCSDGQLS